MTPDCGDHEVQLLAAQALERGAQVLTVHHESQHPLIHIENSQKCVWDHECLIVFEIGGVRLPRLVLGVVVDFVAAEVPPPRVLVVADEALVADAVNWRFRCK